MSNKSNNHSLKARFSQPNRKAKLNEYKRIHDLLVHFKIVSKMLTDR